MHSDLIHFETISRESWQQLHRETTPPLSKEELEAITSFNDQISLQDVTDIYLPLINLIQIYKRAKDDLAFSKGIFLQNVSKERPFIIGISGSVAVGKSTTSRLLQILLSRTFKSSRVQLVTTDGFLYPNAELEARDLLQKKGFPQSYNMEKLLDFLDKIKNAQEVDIPLYSHEIYDVLEDSQTIPPSDFIIVEGINVFQNPLNQNLYMTDFFDFSIYVDAEVENIEKWYLDRFIKHLTLAKTDPNNYYHRFSQMTENEVADFAHQIWTDINLVNLEHYIAPTRSRADIILHKAQDHLIDEIYLKK